MALPSEQSVLEKEKLIRFIDSLISTCNPAILSDGSNAHDAPLPRLTPHACSARYTDIVDHPQDLADLIASCQRAALLTTVYAYEKDSRHADLDIHKPFSL